MLISTRALLFSFSLAAAAAVSQAQIHVIARTSSMNYTYHYGGPGSDHTGGNTVGENTLLLSDDFTHDYFDYVEGSGNIGFWTATVLFSGSQQYSITGSLDDAQTIVGSVNTSSYALGFGEEGYGSMISRSPGNMLTLEFVPGSTARYTIFGRSDGVEAGTYVAIQQLSGSSWVNEIVTAYNAGDYRTGKVLTAGTTYRIAAAVSQAGPNFPLSSHASFTFTRSAELHGDVMLQDFTGIPSGVPLTIDIYQGFSRVQHLEDVRVDQNGRYSVDLTAFGTFDVYMKAGHWLQQAAFGVEIPDGGSAVASFSLRNGDIDGDNEVGLSDFGILSETFGEFVGDEDYDPRADLDGDGEIGLADFGILSARFGDLGD